MTGYSYSSVRGMASSVFRFKRFEVRNERSAMKVNTDGVLLGAWCGVTARDRFILDVGTGTGTVALIAAQRRADLGGEDFLVEGIDIDADSAAEAAGNFASSPWAGRMRAREVSLQEYRPQGEVDLVVANPPYFTGETRAPQERRCGARHCVSLSYADVLEFASRFLSPSGRVALVLPSGLSGELLDCASQLGLPLVRIMFVKSSPRKDFFRVLAEFARERRPLQREELCIHDGAGFSQEYIKKTSELYLKF